MKHLFILTALPLLATCATPSQTAKLSCGDAGAFTRYFPVGTFKAFVPPPRPGLIYRSSPYDPDPDHREWRSEELDYLELPSLSCGTPSADETYRLDWLRSFHAPVAIEVSRTSDTYTLNAVTTNETRHNGKPLRHIRRSLTKDEWIRITASLQEIGFWDLPPNNEESGYFYDPDKKEEVVITAQKDGARWIIEGRTDRYHVIDRWSNEAAEVAVGRIFIDLAGLNIPEEDIY